MIINNLTIKHKETTLLNINFEIKENTALIGQSGSGKSLTLKSILGMLPSNLHQEFDYTCNFELSKENIAYIPQNPFTSLSPLTKITKQFFCEKEKQIELLNLVGLKEDYLSKYPMQLSGGELQRIVIAISLTKTVKLLLLDEPTTALDSKNKKIIIELFKKISTQFNIKILYVTHDIMSIKDICLDILILKEGEICERGNIHEILNNPKESYTKELLESNFSTREYRK
jgi:peptide/nickel transport system ATP-binding protein